MPTTTSQRSTSVGASKAEDTTPTDTHHALQDRGALVERARRMLMQTRGLDAERADRFLRARSRDTSRGLHEVAESLLEARQAFDNATLRPSV